MMHTIDLTIFDSFRSFIPHTLRQSKLAMENQSFIDDFPMKTSIFPWDFPSNVWFPEGKSKGSKGLERCQPCQENMLTSDWQWLVSEVHTREISCDVRWCTSAVDHREGGGVQFFFFMGITWYNHGNDLQNSGNPHSNGYTWSKPLAVTGKPGPGWVVLSQVLPEKLVQNIMAYHLSIIFDRPSVSPKPGQAIGSWDTLPKGFMRWNPVSKGPKYSQFEAMWVPWRGRSPKKSDFWTVE